MKLKLVGRYDPCNKILRLFRIYWHSKNSYNSGLHWKSKKMSLALWKKWYHIQIKEDNVMICFLGVRVHYMKSYSGLFV